MQKDQKKKCRPRKSRWKAWALCAVLAGVGLTVLWSVCRLCAGDFTGAVALVLLAAMYLVCMWQVWEERS